MGSKKEDFDQFRERSNTAAGDGGEQQQILPQRSSMLLDANGNIDAYGDADGNSSVCLDLDQDQEYWSSTSEEGENLMVKLSTVVFYFVKIFGVFFRREVPILIFFESIRKQGGSLMCVRT